MDSIRGDTQEPARAISVMLDALLDRRDLDPEIPNAIAISFLVPQELQATAEGTKVWQDIPERVRLLMLASSSGLSSEKNDRAAQQRDEADER
jgi:hypothetical protein